MISIEGSLLVKPERQGNGKFQLTLEPQDVGRAFQICAHHGFHQRDWRTNFPLSSLKSQGKLPSNFFEEVFPGAHTDVGGGYPLVAQYQKDDLPERYGKPTHSSYNRELIKVLSLQDKRQDYAYRGGVSDFNAMLAGMQQAQQKQWNEECQRTYQQYGQVKEENAILYFYRLQPIDNSLAGLAQERMKQQAERFGVEWLEKEYTRPKDYDENPAQKAVWQNLADLPLGSITPSDWQAKLPAHCIHRSHDSVINPGCSSMIDRQVNGIAHVEDFKRYQPDGPLNTPNREVYDNE